jgi:uncharacterized protein
MRHLGLGLALLALVAGFVYVYRTPLPTASVGSMSLRLELARTPAEQELGLGGRGSVPEGSGMLFIFPTPGAYGIWMKGMEVPIDILWLDAQGHVISYLPSVPPSTYPTVFYPPAPAQYVLETAAGFAHAAAISPGTSILLQNI